MAQQNTGHGGFPRAIFTFPQINIALLETERCVFDDWLIGIAEANVAQDNRL